MPKPELTARLDTAEDALQWLSQYGLWLQIVDGAWWVVGRNNQDTVVISSGDTWREALNHLSVDYDWEGADENGSALEMIGTAHRYQQAFNLVQEGHAGQVDKRGQDYLQHLVAVSMGSTNRIVGLLHDYFEDVAGISEIDTPKFDFLLPIEKEALRALTRKEGESYFSYINRVKNSNPLAVSTKLADLNNHLETLNLMPEPYIALRSRYLTAKKKLTANVSHE